MKQTAVEWLQNCLTVHFSEIEQQVRFKGLFDKAKDLEKQQIIDAYKDGRTDQQSKFPLYYNRKSEQYYNETFTKQTRIENDNINVTNK